MTKEIQLTTTLKHKLLKSVMSGTPLSKVCKDDDMPSLSKVYSWIAKHQDFAKDLVQARRCGAQSYIDQSIEALQTAREDKSVRAIVIRVDSPGGSALASDLIWREVKQTRERKPIIVSMSDVAASGGYYISAAATEIVAQLGTITG